jgi:hypothetical protein
LSRSLNVPIVWSVVASSAMAAGYTRELDEADEHVVDLCE